MLKAKHKLKFLCRYKLYSELRNVSKRYQNVSTSELSYSFIAIRYSYSLSGAAFVENQQNCKHFPNFLAKCLFMLHQRELNIVTKVP